LKGVHAVGVKGYFRHLRDPKTHWYTNADKSLHPIPSHLRPAHKINLLISEIFEPSHYKILIGFLCGPGSSVGIATDYGLDGPESNPGGNEIFRPSRPVLGPTQPPVKWVPGLSRGFSAAGACCWPLTPF